MADEEYDELRKLQMPDLTAKAAGWGTGSALEKAKLVREELLLEQQQKDTKQQLDRHHKENKSLIERQLRWIIGAAILNAVAIVLGVLLGWFLDTKTHELQKVQQQVTELLHDIKRQNGSSRTVLPSQSSQNIGTVNQKKEQKK